MGNQIIKQPDGHYAVLDSGSGVIAVWNASKDEIVEWFVQLELAALERHKQRIAEIVDQVAAGNTRAAYAQFAKSWEQALASDRQHGGEAWKEYGDVQQ